MFAFNAVPNERHGAVLPATFVNAVQLRLRLPLSLLRLAGVTTCKCGAAMDCYGDHILACRACMSDRTPWHDLIVDVVARMAQTANMHVSVALCWAPTVCLLGIRILP